MENTVKAAILLVLVSFAVGAYAYPLLPAQVASHWGLAGQPNGHMPTIFGAFWLPLMMLLLLAVFLIIPVTDPLRANIQLFKGYYYGFVLAITTFLFVIYVQTLLWNFGTVISFNLTVPILLGCLFFYAGIAVGKTKRNWFVGIRTPWTLSSDEVWDRTNALGGKVFKAVGVIFILSVLLPAYTIAIIIGVLAGAVVGLILYSYVEYAKLMKTGKKPGKHDSEIGTRKKRKV